MYDVARGVAGSKKRAQSLSNIPHHPLWIQGWTRGQAQVNSRRLRPEWVQMCVATCIHLRVCLCCFRLRCGVGKSTNWGLTE